MNDSQNKEDYIKKEREYQNQIRQIEFEKSQEIDSMMQDMNQLRKDKEKSKFELESFKTKYESVSN